MASPETNHRPPEAEPAAALYSDSPEQPQNEILEPDFEDAAPGHRIVEFYEPAPATRAEDPLDPLTDKTQDEILNDTYLFTLYLLRQTPRFNALVRGFVFDRHEVSSVVQETIIKAVTKGDRQRIMSNPAGWIGKVARRVHVDQHRKREARPKEVLVDDFYSSIERPIGGLSIEENTVAASGAARVLEILAEHDAMPGIQNNNSLKELFVKIFYEDMSMTDYAAHKGIPVGTVKSRLHYGKKLVREEFEREAKEARRLGMET